MARNASRKTVALALLPAVVHGFAGIDTLSLSKTHAPRQGLHMALTPVGPFCPFRSSNFPSDPDENFEDSVDSSDESDLHTLMNRLSVEVTSGASPSPDLLKTIADRTQAAVRRYDMMNERLRSSSDFQVREFSKYISAFSGKYNLTADEIAGVMKWQAECMRAMADNLLPPAFPPNIEVVKVMERMEAVKFDNPFLTKGMLNSVMNMITQGPFVGDESAFESPLVKQELEELYRDHRNLIELGARYGSFDRLGKLAYIDEIEKVEERWDIFFARFSLMGALDKEFVRQCNVFLASMGLDETEYRTLLKKCHDMMREEAQAFGVV